MKDIPKMQVALPNKNFVLRNIQNASLKDSHIVFISLNNVSSYPRHV